MTGEELLAYLIEMLSEAPLTEENAPLAEYSTAFTQDGRSSRWNRSKMCLTLSQTPG